MFETTASYCLPGKIAELGLAIPSTNTAETTLNKTSENNRTVDTNNAA